MHNKTLTVAAVLGLLAAMPVRAQAPAAPARGEKEFNWGIETWKKGQNDFVIRFKEPGHVRISRIYGNLTAGPQPEHAQFAKLIRQTIVSLVNVGAVDTDQDVEIVATPADRANQSVDRNMININVKQTDSETMSIPIEYNYAPARALAENKILVRIFNESYKIAPNGIAIVSDDQGDALNVELHLVVDYETE